MAYMRLPDNSYFKFDDKLTDQQAAMLAQQKYPQIFGIKPQEGVGAEFKKGWEQLKGSTETGIRSLFGNAQEAAAQGAARNESIGNRYADQIGWDKVTDKFNAPDGGLFSAAGEFARQVPLAIAGQAPNIAATMGSAGAGAMAGAPLGPVGSVIGGAVGALAPSFLQQLGGNVERQQEVTPGQINVGNAAMAAAPQAALDAVGTFIPMGKVITGKVLGPTVAKFLERGGSEAAERLAKESLLKTVAKGTAVGVMAEVPTEVAQQMLERHQAGLSLTDADAQREYAQTAYQTGLLAPIGAAGRYVDRGAARTQVEATSRAATAKAAKEALDAESAKKQTPEYLQDLTQRYDEAKTARDTISSQIKQLRASKKDASKDEARDIDTQVKSLGAQLKTAQTQFGPIEREYGERADDVANVREQQRVAGLHPMEALVGEKAPEGGEPPTDTSFVDMAQGQQFPGRPQAPAPNYLNDFLRSLEDPNAAAVGVSTLHPQEVTQALLTRPDLAKRMLSSGERYPGTKSTAESNLWKKELAKQFKAAIATPPPVQDSTQPINQMIADRERMGQEQLAADMSAGREAAAAREVQRKAQEEAQRQSLAAQDALDPKILHQMLPQTQTPENIGRLVDEGRLTPMLSKRLGIEHPGEGPLNLLDRRDAEAAAPAINNALRNVLDLRQKITENKTDANTSKLPKLEMQVNELKRLQLHLNDTLDPNKLATESMIEGQLQAASPKRAPGVNVGLPIELQPQQTEAFNSAFAQEPTRVEAGQPKGLQSQQYGERARALGANHENITGELYSQLDELSRGTFFRDPNAEQRDAAQFVWGNAKQRELKTREAMQLEQTLVRKANEAKQALVQNLLQEAAAKRAATGAPGLTAAEAVKAAMDVRSAVDALIDKSRRVDDSATSFVADPSKDKVIHDALGHVRIVKGGRTVTEQQLRAKKDLAYAQVYETKNFTEAAHEANAIIDKARAALATPLTPKQGPARKGAFQLAPQSEVINQAMERQASGEKLPAGEMRDNRRIQTTIDRIQQVQQRPKGVGMANARGLGMTRALLEKARQFLLSTTEVTARNVEGAATEARLATGKVGTEMLDGLDQTIERFQKGMAADPETARSIIDRINSIEREGQDQRHQMDMFGEGKVFETANPEQMQRFITERQRQAPVAEQAAAAKAAEARMGYVPAGLATQAKIARLDATIAQARAKVARLEGMVRTKSDSAQLGHVRKLLNELEGKATLAAVEARSGKVPRSLSEAFAKLNEVNGASEEMRKTIARAEMQARATEKNAAPVEKRVVEEAKAPVVTEQPKEAAPGMAVTKSTVETVPIIAKRKGKKYEIAGTSYDEAGNYIAPAQRQRVERTTMQTEVERKLAEREALKARMREEWEDRQRQKAQLAADHARGIAQEMTKEELAQAKREAFGAAASRKGEASRKNVPNMSKGRSDAELRASKIETSGTEDPGTPPAAKMPEREVPQGAIGVESANMAQLAQQRQGTRAPISPRMKERVTKALADTAAARAKRDAIRQQHEERALEQASKKKPSAQYTATPATGTSTVAALEAEIAAEFGDTKGKVTVVPTRADMPAPGRAVTIDGNHVYIAADEVGPGQARGLVLHELGVHVGMDEDTVAEAHAALEDMVRNGDEHSDLAAKALAMQKKSASTDTRDEAVAHFVELASNAGVKPTEGAAKFFKPLMDWARKLLAKFGLANDKLTTQDIVDMARGAADKALQESKQKAGAVQYSSTPKYAADYDKAAQDVENRLISQPSGLRKNMRDFVTGFRMHFIDAFDPVQKIADGMADSVKALQMMYDLRMYKQASNATNEVALNGNLVIDKIKRPDGRIERMVKSKQGDNLKDMAKELKHAGVGDLDAADRAFKTYMIAERAESEGYDSVVGFLPKDSDKNPLVTEAELKDRLAAGRANPVFQKVRGMYRNYANGLIDFAVETGAIPAEEGKRLKASGDYVSFYRQDGDTINLVVNGERIMTVGSIKSQPYLKNLVGSTSPITGFLEGALQNTRLLTEMALRNMATKNTAETLTELKLARIQSKEISGKNVIHFRNNGQDKYAVIDTDAIGVPTEVLVTGLEGIATQLPAAFRLLGVPSRMLRQFIVRNPLYAARQVVRDSLANSLLAGVDGVPVASTVKEIGKMLAGRSNAERDLQQRLIVGGQALTGDMDDKATILKQIGSGKLGWQTAMGKLDFWAMQADAAARVTAYNSARANGLTDMEATLAALETMNFNRRGVSPTMHALGTMIPFMNAQIQGLDVLYRSFTGKMPFNEQLKVKQKLITRGLMMAATTMAYAAMMDGDDDYENASMTDKLQNWFFPVPGTDVKLRIPTPFEAGYLFKALPEALYTLATKDGKNGEVLSAFGQMAMNSMPGVIPQGLKPVIEGALNREFYTGRDIEDSRMQGLKVSERYGDRTTEIAKALGGSFEIAGREIGVSPAQIDHYVRGYTGALGMAILGLADGLVASGVAKPTRKLNETPILGPLFLEKDATAAVSEAYKMIEQYGRAKSTFDKMVAEGRGDDAERFADKFGDQIARADASNKIKAELGRLTKMEQQIRSSDMTGDEKREALDDLRREKIALSRDAMAALRE
jgi:hypothetical protein